MLQMTTNNKRESLMIMMKKNKVEKRILQPLTIAAVEEHIKMMMYHRIGLHIIVIINMTFKIINLSSKQKKNTPEEMYTSIFKMQ